MNRTQQNRSAKVAVLAAAVCLLLESSATAAFTTRGRGKTAEYDPGPKKDSLWVPLFGSVPNYRKIGKDYLGSEKFRWNIGPMWYRGRLGEDQVKVLVVGQEGAQDENTSNRTFTGGTGTKTQNMLKALEMDRSYLFLNTFVYTIFGQRETKGSLVKKYMEMEQGLDSPIVKYRHQLMDYTAQYNKDSLALMVAVGGGARDSLVTWIESRGGKCPGKDPNRCDTDDMKIYKQEFGQQSRANEAGLMSEADGIRYTNETVKLANKTVVIHVPHPGMARFSGGAEAVAKGFKRSADRLKAFIRSNKTWLDGRSGRPKPDTGDRDDIVKNLDNFTYKNTPVPHRDFAFGTTWRLGDGGTNTTRDGQDAIAIWAKGQKYGTRGNHDKSILGREVRDGRKENDGRPWEPARWNSGNPAQAKAYDYGPCGYVEPGDTCNLAELMMDWPDFTKISDKVDQHESFGFGRIYRGNPQSAKLVVLADQYSVDDFFTARALTGEVGQKLQTYLAKKGYSNSDSNKQNDYVILRTLPIDTSTMDRDDREDLALESSVASRRKALVDEVVSLSRKAGVRSVEFLAVGSLAAKAADKLGHDFKKISSRDLPDQLTDIPREDLPYSTRYFMGTSGNRATVDGGQFYRFQAPYWVKRTPIPN